MRCVKVFDDFSRYHGIEASFMGQKAGGVVLDAKLIKRNRRVCSARDCDTGVIEFHPYRIKPKAVHLCAQCAVSTSEVQHPANAETAQKVEDSRGNVCTGVRALR